MFSANKSFLLFAVAGSSAMVACDHHGDEFDASVKCPDTGIRYSDRAVIDMTKSYFKERSAMLHDNKFQIAEPLRLADSDDCCSVNRVGFERDPDIVGEEVSRVAEYIFVIRSNIKLYAKMDSDNSGSSDWSNDSSSREKKWSISYHAVMDSCLNLFSDSSELIAYDDL